MTAETQYKWIHLNEMLQKALGNQQELLGKLDKICIEWDKEKSALKNPWNDRITVKKVEDLFKPHKKKEPTAKQKSDREAYEKKIDEIDLKQMDAIQALLFKKSEACVPLDCEVYSSNIAYGSRDQFVPGEVIIGGPVSGTTITSKCSGTELEVKCEQHPQVKRIRFEGAAHIQAGDTIRAYSFRGLRIDQIMPNAVHLWYNLILEKKKRLMPAFEKFGFEQEHVIENDHWSDIDKTEKLYITMLPSETADCFRIEKIDGPKVLIAYTLKE